MKITKEEKQLHNFLKIVYTIFSKTTARTLLFGHRNKLYFKTPGHAGIFNMKTELLVNSYTFDDVFYELKQLPNGSYELQPYGTDDVISIGEKVAILEKLILCENCNHFELELEKEDRFKLAKIIQTSRMWISDDDIKYLKGFDKFEVISNHNESSLVVRSEQMFDDNYTKVIINLIFNTDINVDEKHVQQKFPIPDYEDDPDNIDEFQKEINQSEEVDTVEDIELQELAKEMEIEEEEDDPMS